MTEIRETTARAIGKRVLAAVMGVFGIIGVAGAPDDLAVWGSWIKGIETSWLYVTLYVVAVVLAAAILWPDLRALTEPPVADMENDDDEDRDALDEAPALALPGTTITRGARPETREEIDASVVTAPQVSPRIIESSRVVPIGAITTEGLMSFGEAGVIAGVERLSPDEEKALARQIRRELRRRLEPLLEDALSLALNAPRSHDEISYSKTRSGDVAAWERKVMQEFVLHPDLAKRFQAAPEPNSRKSISPVDFVRHLRHRTEMLEQIVESLPR